MAPALHGDAELQKMYNTLGGIDDWTGIDLVLWAGVLWSLPSQVAAAKTRVYHLSPGLAGRMARDGEAFALADALSRLCLVHHQAPSLAPTARRAASNCSGGSPLLTKAWAPAAKAA